MTGTGNQKAVAERTLAAIASSRTTSAPWLACMLGIQSVRTTAADSELRPTPLPPPLPGELGVLDVAMLADLASGAALRSRLGAGLIMPTLTLSLELTDSRTADDLAALAWAVNTGRRSATARGELRSGRYQMGVYLAAFAVPQRPLLAAPLPWEDPDDGSREQVPVLDPRWLTAAEQDIVESVHEVGNAPAGCSLAEALVGRACVGDPSNPGQGRLRPSPVMLNRAGRIQGAVLFGVAANAARTAAADGSARIASGHMHFLTAADADTDLDVDAVVLRSGRHFLFARADLRQRSQLVATGSFRLFRDT